MALGGLYERGEGVVKDQTRAAALYARGIELRTASCERGDAWACARMGYSLREGGLGLKSDSTRALTFFERACDLGNDDACRTAAAIYDSSAVAPRNPERAKALFARAKTLLAQHCDEGNVQACAYVDTPRANYKACDLGDPSGCWRLGRDYVPEHDGSTRDVSRAVYFFLKGCDLGDGSLCMSVADLYAEGRWLRADAPRAAALHEKACALGEGEGCARAGQMYLTGRGVPKDERRGRELLAKADELSQRKP